MVFQAHDRQSGRNRPCYGCHHSGTQFCGRGPDNPRYGFHHQESATTSRQISFVADAPAQTLATAGTDYNVVDLPQDILDTLAAWGATDSLDTTATLSLGGEDGNYIQADGKTATITVQLYGGPETDFNITLFINHQPVQLNGADYLSVRTVKNQMVEATFKIDTSALGTLNTVYAIAVTPEDGELEINNPVKTASVTFGQRGGLTNMKRISILLALTLSLSLLSACGGNEPAASTGNPSSESSADSQQVPDGSAEQTAGIGADFLSPEYDYTTNELKLTDLSTGEVTATYAFDAAQTPLLTDKTSQGAIVMLSSQTAADVQDTGGVTVISGDSSAETLYYWLFDQKP